MATNYLKQIARDSLSEHGVEQLARLKARLSMALTVNPYVRAFTLLPRRQAVRIRESIRLTGKLDYSHGGILMTLDSSAQLNRLHSCAKEPGTVKWIEACFRAGDVFYDIGANVGSYSFVAHEVTRGDCTIYAFEPSFSTFAALCHNVLLNKCHGKVIPLHVALSNDTQLLTFNYSSVTPGAALHSVGKAINQDGQAFQPTYTQPVLSYRLDDLVSQFELRPPTHIKLDVDGFEIDVLRGADKILSHPSLQYVFAEVNEKRYTCAEIVSYLESKGFSIQSRHPAPMSEGFSNYLFGRQNGKEPGA